MRYLSLFTGIGGFEVAIQNAFIKQGAVQGRASQFRSDIKQEQLPVQPLCVGYSEIDKHAIKTYEEHFNHENYGDATTISATELPDFDLIVGGFPCQAFSVAGKRRGFEETRGTLFFDIARICAEKRPRHLVLENVKGLLSHDEGKTFQTILGVLADLGYRVEWQLLNSKHFGVPQNRERVYIVGHLGADTCGKVFPITRTNGSAIKQLRTSRHDHQRVYGTDGIAPTINTGQRGNAQPKIKAVLTPARATKRQRGRRFKDTGEPAFTVNTQDQHGIYDGAIIRRLTPMECERLQGFPDNWTIGSDTQRYKQCGNAITTNVAEAVFSQLLKNCEVS